MAVTSNGLTAYCNKKALLALSQRLAALAESDESEHYEAHVCMDLEADECVFEGHRPSNVWVLRTKELAPLLAPHDAPETADFELTFMVVQEAELDDLADFQKDGLLPDDWQG